MSAELIYKTTSPSIIDWYRDLVARSKAEGDARFDYASKITAEIGPGREYAERVLYVSRGWGGETRVIGIQETEAEYADRSIIPNGLRYDKVRGYLVPALRTPRGKQFAAEFATLTSAASKPQDELHDRFGVPSGIMGGGNGEGGIYRYNAGMDFDSKTGTLYMVWGSGRVQAELEAGIATHPEVEWIEVPRSEWYAREEAHNLASAN